MQREGVDRGGGGGWRQRGGKRGLRDAELDVSRKMEIQEVKEWREW